MNWRFIIEQIEDHHCLPLISHRICDDYIFPGRNIVQEWANQIDYPLLDCDRLVRVGLYHTIMSGDEKSAKIDYLDFLKQACLTSAQASAQADALSEHEHFFRAFKKDLPRMTVSQVVSRLYYSRLQTESDNLWRNLAELPFPIYLTTSYHNLMEVALRAVGKEPQSYFYPWSYQLRKSASPDIDLGMEPTVNAPLVYHIHGMDSDADSLVFTEDNFFEFLENVTDDLEDIDTGKPVGIPDVVREALTSSTMLLLGYNLFDWEFRVAFRSVIHAIGRQDRPLSHLVQFRSNSTDDIEKANVQEYLRQYARNHNFSIYWGNVRDFVHDLRQEWE